MRLLAILFLILLPSIAWAVGAFGVPPTDKSMEYLGWVFGKMGDLPVGTMGNPLFGKLMTLFNEIVFALAAIIVVHTTIMATIHTAHEGEVMGKKWSSIFIPARIGAGLWLLIPSSSGYSYIQLLIMWFLVQGVGLANSVWEQVLIAYDRGEGIHEKVNVSALATPLPPTSDTAGSQDTDNTVLGVFKSELCLQLVNSTQENLDVISHGELIAPFRSADGKKIMWGIESTQQPVCGSVELPTKSTLDKAYAAASGLSDSTDEKFEQFRNEVASLILDRLSFDLSGSAKEAVEEQPENWLAFDGLVTAAGDLKREKQNIATKMATGGAIVKSDITKSALADGWIHAGSYYFLLVSGGAKDSSSDIRISVMGPNFTIVEAGDFGKTLSTKIDSLSTEYVKVANDNLSANEQLGINQESKKSYALPSALKFLEPTIRALHEPTKAMIQRMSAREDTDPLLSLAKTGSEIVNATEIMYLAFIVLSAATLAFSLGKGCVSWGHVFPALLSLTLPILMVLLAFLYVAGMTLALYVPLIPFLVFTFASIAWIVLVIEAIVAAPLVAMILVVPSEDELGKAGYSLVILLGLILRPALMIVGFIVAIKFLFVAVKMLNFGFVSVMFENIPSWSLFIPVAVIVLYTSVVTYVVHEAFSLIYVIPDKVLRWMGGTPETEDIMGKVKKGKGDVERGAGAAKTGMSGSMDLAGKGTGSQAARQGRQKKA